MSHAKYAWIITKDLISDDDEPSAVGKVGPHNINPALLATLKTVPAAAVRFRMLDDDGSIYFHGLIVGDYDGFEPLDSYGRPSHGCTEIQYRESAKWTRL